MILFLNVLIIFSGIFCRKPANTIKSGDALVKSFKTKSLLNSVELNTKLSMLYFFIRSKTNASGLLQYILLTSILGLFLNDNIMFSTLDPLPEANMAIFFEDNFVAVFLILSLLIKIKLKL